MGTEEEENDKGSRQERQKRRITEMEGSLIGVEEVASLRTDGLIILVTPTDDSRFAIKTCLKSQKRPNKTGLYNVQYKKCEVM